MTHVKRRRQGGGTGNHFGNMKVLNGKTIFFSRFLEGACWRSFSNFFWPALPDYPPGQPWDSAEFFEWIAASRSSSKGSVALTNLYAPAAVSGRNGSCPWCFAVGIPHRFCLTEFFMLSPALLNFDQAAKTTTPILPIGKLGLLPVSNPRKHQGCERGECNGERHPVYVHHRSRTSTFPGKTLFPVTAVHCPARLR